MKYRKEDLHQLTILLFQACGLSQDRAKIVAETLIMSDLMGHTTHGLALLPVYLNQLETGGMQAEGEPTIIQDQGSSFSWDGNYLSGPYLVYQAIDLALQRSEQYPVVTATIQKSHHIACLAAYLEKATEKGLMMILSSSDPGNRTVSPYGGLQGVYSPNPIAAGIPTSGDPILFDISMSTTANGVVNQKHKAGERLPKPWLQDAAGNMTDDPAAFFADPPGTVLPLGSHDAGYKGFALGILVEALTSALGGNGRLDDQGSWGASVFLQIIDPEAFGGLDYFKKEMSFLVEKAMASPAPTGGSPVRLPGQRALALRKEQLESGVALYPGIIPAIEPYAEKYGVEMPQGC